MELYLKVLTESTSALADFEALLLLVADGGNPRVILYGPLTRQLSPKFMAVEEAGAFVVRTKDRFVIGVFSLQENGENGFNNDSTFRETSFHSTEV